MNKKPANNITRIESKVTEEDKAFDFLMMHYNRVMTMDEISDKAINRAGKVGDAIRDLLESIQTYARARNVAKVTRLENESNIKMR